MSFIEKPTGKPATQITENLFKIGKDFDKEYNNEASSGKNLRYFIEYINKIHGYSNLNIIDNIDIYYREYNINKPNKWFTNQNETELFTNNIKGIIDKIKIYSGARWNFVNVARVPLIGNAIGIGHGMGLFYDNKLKELYFMNPNGTVVDPRQSSSLLDIDYQIFNYFVNQYNAKSFLDNIHSEALKYINTGGFCSNGFNDYIFAST